MVWTLDPLVRFPTYVPYFCRPYGSRNSGSVTHLRSFIRFFLRFFLDFYELFSLV